MSKLDADIPESTSAKPCVQPNNNVTPQSPVEPAMPDGLTPTPVPSDSSNKQPVYVVIPESIDVNVGELPKPSVKTDAGHPKSSLPRIDVFLSKKCTIPLTRCDFEQIIKTIKVQDEKNKQNESQMEKLTTGTTTDDNKLNVTTVQASDASAQPEVCTSSRKCTVINYKKFLEEFTDVPPSPPKKKKEIDLKHRPLKSRMTQVCNKAHQCS